MLKDITIVTADSLNYETTAFAIDKALAVFPDADVIQIGDKRYHDKGRFYEVPKFDAKEHSRLCLQMVPDLVETNWALYIQYDGFPTHPEFWSDEFLKYDYIGAPWQKNEAGWDVGNGGFSLRSKKLLNMIKMIKTNPNGTDLEWLEDQLICVTHRRWLMGNGINFAPKEIAEQFSHEHPTGYFPSFGFHGSFQTPYYLTDEEFAYWIAHIDDSTFKGKSLCLTPYGLWKKEMWSSLRALMIRGNKLYPDWNQRCWAELHWIIPNYVDPTVDLKEMFDMVQRMGAPEDI
jgi:hypothetical protein